MSVKENIKFSFVYVLLLLPLTVSGLAKVAIINTNVFA